MIEYRNVFRRELGREGSGEGGRIRRGSQGEVEWRSWGRLSGSSYSVVPIFACWRSSGPSKDEAGDRGRVKEVVLSEQR